MEKRISTSVVEIKKDKPFKFSFEQCELYNVHSDECVLVSPNVQMPKYLYRYRQFSDREIESILNGTLWLSKPKLFKDILDSSLNIDFASSEENFKKFLKESREELFREFPANQYS